MWQARPPAVFGSNLSARQQPCMAVVRLTACTSTGGCSCHTAQVTRARLSQVVARQQLHGVHDGRQPPPLTLRHPLQSIEFIRLCAHTTRKCYPSCFHVRRIVPAPGAGGAHLPPAGGAQYLLQQVRRNLAAQEGRQLLVQLALVDLGLRHPGVAAQSTASLLRATLGCISAACLARRVGVPTVWRHPP